MVIRYQLPFLQDNLTPNKDQENNKDSKGQPFGFKDINNMAYEDLDYCSFSSALKSFGSCRLVLSWWSRSEIIQRL